MCIIMVIKKGEKGKAQDCVEEKRTGLGSMQTTDAKSRKESMKIGVCLNLPNP